jgi:chorismate dehydratase
VVGGAPCRKPLRLGVVSYLNAVPLAYGLERDPRFQVVRDLPSRIADQLHAGKLDLGMIPSIEYARGDYAIVPGVAIGSRGPVRSVCLFHRRPVEEIGRVALDTSSRTSVALARVLLRQRLGRDPEYVAMPPPLHEMLRVADAALLIGDPALDYDGDLARLDLGGEWNRQTGLPFVYAFWAGPRGALGGAEVERVQGALRDGLARVAEIASGYNGDRGRRELYESYLRSNIAFGLGAPEAEGLREFFRRARAAGLIERVPELSFHGDR